MDERPVLDRIETLVEEEHRLGRAGEDGGLTGAEHGELQGLERTDQVKYAVLDRDGQISVIPR